MAKAPLHNQTTGNGILFEDWLLQIQACEEDPVLQCNARGFPPSQALSSVHQHRRLVLRKDVDDNDMDGTEDDSDILALIYKVEEMFPDAMRDDDCISDGEDEDFNDEDLHTPKLVEQKRTKPPAVNPAAFSQTKSDDDSSASNTRASNAIPVSSAPSQPPAVQNPYATSLQQQAAHNPYGTSLCATDQTRSSVPAQPVAHNPYAANPPAAAHAGANPYHQQHLPPPAPVMPPPQQLNPYYTNGNSSQAGAPAPPPTWESTPSGPPHASYTQQWEAHHNAQQQVCNPFQTARDYSQQNQPSHRPDPPNGSTSPPPPPQPAIRPSLKRKFQPPKRNTAPQKQQQPPSSQQPTPLRNQSNHRGNSNNSNAVPVASTKSDGPNDESDDDLPEELQKYGKELVQAIESEILSSCATVSFADIAGLENQKEIVQEVVIWPMQRPDLFTGLRRAPNGLLLYGPPGTGKTLIGKAIAHESTATFFGISSSSLTSKWMGQGEKLVRTLFAVAAYREPAVVFIDEIDSLLKARSSDENEATRRIKTEFLVQIDGVGSQGARVLVIGATNRPQELDDAARRRFTKRLYIPLPTQSDREELLRVLLQSCRHGLEEDDIEQLALEAEGFSGADLKSMATDAAMGPLRELSNDMMGKVDANDIPAIELRHFQQALASMKPSVSPQDITQYQEWDELYGSKRAKGAP